MSTQPTGRVPQWTLADRLRKARELTGMNQKEFAEQLGVSRGTVSNAETTNVEVREITLKAWAMATGVPLQWLKTGSSPDPGPDGEPSGCLSPQVRALLRAA